MTSPDFFQFFSQAKIMSGNRAMDNIPVELDGFDARKPLVITTKEVTKAGLGRKFAKACYDSNVVIGAIFDEVPYYAGISQVRDLVKLFRDRGCDSLIAIGGGAAADVAKCINIMVSEETDDLLQFVGENKINPSTQALYLYPDGLFGRLRGGEPGGDRRPRDQVRLPVS